MTFAQLQRVDVTIGYALGGGRRRRFCFRREQEHGRNVVMDTLVLPLATMPTLDGDAFGLLAQLPGGRIDMQLSPSWAAAAEALAARLQGRVSCDESLATVGRRHGWEVVTPTETQRLECAAIAVGVTSDLIEAQAAMPAFCSAWVEFYRLGLWEQVPPELSVRALRRQGSKTTEHCIALLGQAKVEFGLAFYEDPHTFDAIWNGENYPMDGLSVLADENRHLLPAFQPFGVPPPIVTSIVASRAKAPTKKDFVLATAAMQLLINVTTGEPNSFPLSRGVSLELMQEEPKKKPRSRTSRAAAKSRRSR